VLDGPLEPVDRAEIGPGAQMRLDRPANLVLDVGERLAEPLEPRRLLPGLELGLDGPLGLVAGPGERLAVGLKPGRLIAALQLRRRDTLSVGGRFLRGLVEPLERLVFKPAGEMRFELRLRLLAHLEVALLEPVIHRSRLVTGTEDRDHMPDIHAVLPS